MSSDDHDRTRRHFLRSVTFGAAALAAPAALAAERRPTPKQTEGPFYPNKLPLDTDNDLLLVNDATRPAAGEVTHLAGRVVGPSGEPVRNATVEIWQVDSNGIYLHSDSPQRDRRDSQFQGFGRFLTNRSGEYYFRTIKPVPYTFGIRRTPHIHFIVRKGEKRLLTTQMYIKGHPMNEEDSIFRSLRTEEARRALTVDFKPVEDSRSDELAAQFDMVLGKTPEDPA